MTTSTPSDAEHAEAIVRAMLGCGWILATAHCRLVVDGSFELTPDQLDYIKRIAEDENNKPPQ